MKLLRWAGLVGLFGGLLVPAFAAAVSPNVSRSFAYQTTQPIPAGSLVSLLKPQGTVVELANVANGARLVGVVVARDDSLLAINPNLGRAQVATSGSANVLVSTLDGDIQAGDSVAVSPLGGLGMDAKPGDRVVGVAQTAFNDKTEGAEVRTVTDTSGHKHKISVGFVVVNIAVGTAPQATANLNGLQKFARSLTGHVVSTARLIIALIIIMLAFGTLITLVYAAIYGGIISIGRNPLAKVPVLRSVREALLMSALIAVLAAVAVFLLLS
ncbi:MAG TPA: hypothetical protein VHB51_04355 [Candidatus Saccharimonadales bacterium]|nr:hypothetical protein [Candidatus Saccharimonadales bacterium]